jgi:hypothetical protein
MIKIAPNLQFFIQYLIVTGFPQLVNTRCYKLLGFKLTSLVAGVTPAPRNTLTATY